MSLTDSLRIVTGGLKGAVILTVATWGIHYTSERIYLPYLERTEGPVFARFVAEAKLECAGDHLLVDLALLGRHEGVSDYLESRGVYKSF